MQKRYAGVSERKQGGVPFGEGKLLGEGASGSVRMVRHEQTGKLFACKSMEVRRLGSNDLEKLRSEIRLLKAMDHPNIMRVFEVYESRRHVHIIMELCRGGDLFTRLHEQKRRRFPEARARDIVRVALTAVAYCHDQVRAALATSLFDSRWGVRRAGSPAPALTHVRAQD